MTRPSLAFNPNVSTLTPRELYERALTVGPWHQDWPFICAAAWCGLAADPSHFPYCSTACVVADSGGEDTKSCNG